MRCAVRLLSARWQTCLENKPDATAAMPMKPVLLVVNRALPAPAGDGVRVGTWLWIETMLSLGVRPAVIPYRVSPEGLTGLEEATERLESKGVKVLGDLARQPIDNWPRARLLAQAILPVRRLSCPNLAGDRAIILRIAQREGPAAILAYDSAAVALLPPLADKWRCIGILVDLPAGNVAARWSGLRQMKGIKRYKEMVQLAGMRKAQKWLLQDIRCLSAVVEHSWRHAEQLRQEVQTKIMYVPHCMPGPEDASIIGLEPADSKNYCLLIMGSLKGATSRLGFEFLLEHLLPRLRAMRGALDRPIKVRIVGHGDMLHTLRQRLMAQPEVEFGPFASTREAIGREYVNCHSVLVPIPVKVGFRTRIAEAFGYGKCVIAHSANCEGMPEVRDGVNALCAENPDELVKRIVNALTDKNLRRRVAYQARQTFLEHYSIAAMKRSVKSLLFPT